MKTLSIVSLLLFQLFAFTTVQAQQKEKASIKVWGNCGMCKKTIEKAATSAGAKKASWDADTKTLAVTYVSDKTNPTKIQQAIAQAGYDTQDFTAPDEVYNALHGCCQYDRKAAANSKTPDACCTDDKCGKDESSCKEKGCCKDKNCCKS